MTAGAMLVEWVGVVATRIASVMADLLPITAGMAAVCTGLYFFSSQVCNQGTPWWRNRGLVTDAWYWLIIPFVAPIIRMSLLIGVAMLMLPFSTEADIKNYVEKGFGPLGALPFWGQVAAYLVISDFLLYWIYRIFHGATMWRFHVIYHSAEDIDWTTAYRFHPVNLSSRAVSDGRVAAIRRRLAEGADRDGAVPDCHRTVRPCEFELDVRPAEIRHRNAGIPPLASYAARSGRHEEFCAGVFAVGCVVRHVLHAASGVAGALRR